jgi:hypothetical protein
MHIAGTSNENWNWSHMVQYKGPVADFSFVSQLSWHTQTRTHARTNLLLYIRLHRAVGYTWCRLPYWRGQVGQCLWGTGSLRYYVSQYGVTVEWYWQGKADGLSGRPVPVSLRPQISHGLTWTRTQEFAVKNSRLTVWPMVRLAICLTTLKCW